MVQGSGSGGPSLPEGLNRIHVRPRESRTKCLLGPSIYQRSLKYIQYDNIDRSGSHDGIHGLSRFSRTMCLPSVQGLWSLKGCR